MKCNVIYSTFYSKCYANLYKNVKTSGFRLLDSVRLDVNHSKCYLVIYQTCRCEIEIEN